MLRDLIKLSTSKRNIRILNESAVKFRDIGAFLLRDDTGAIVNAIANTACGDQVQAVRMIYVKWMEDDEDHSWEKLIQCFRDVQLNSLARDLELHFRLTSPSDRVGRREPDPQLLSQRHLVSKKEAESIVKQLIQKEGKFEQKNMVVVITGLMEAGKTTLLHKLFGEIPPSEYKSTDTIEQPWRCVANYTVCVDGEKGFKLLKNEDMFKVYITKLPSKKDVEESRSLHRFTTGFVNFIRFFFVNFLRFFLQTPSEPRPVMNLSSFTSVEKAVDVVSKHPDKFSGELEFIYMIDTGGQPECLEILPSVIHNANLVLLVVDISKDLDEHITPKLQTSVKPFKKGRLPVSNRQMIKQLAQTMAGRTCSSILIIATHKDLVTETKLKENLKKLNEFVVQVLPRDVILQPKVGYVFDVAFPPKESKEDENVGKIRKHIRGHIETSLEVLPLPSSYVMFEKEIMYYLSNENRKTEVMELKECLNIGEKLNMSANDVRAALQYFHDKNVLLYFGDIGSGLIFVSPKALISVVNTVVWRSYDMITTERDNLKAGIISTKFLKQLTDPFIPGIFEVKDAIEIFNRLYIIATFSQKQSSENEKYIMMCLLPRLEQNEVDARLEIFDEKNPLLIHFGEGSPPNWRCCCSPVGSFGSTIACLMSEFKWTICTDDKDENPECLYHDIAMLHPNEMSSRVTLVNKTEYFEAYIDPKENECANLRKVRREIHDATEKVIRTMNMEKLTVAEGFDCTCEVKEKRHTQYFKPPKTYICKFGNKDTPENVWIEKGMSSWCCWYMLRLVLFVIIGGIIFIAFGFTSVDPTPGLWQMKEPTFKELRHIEYIDTQGENKHFRFIDSAQNDCEDLGIQLNIGPATITGFRSMYDKPSDICGEILLSWINKGEDATWAGLLRGLDHVPALGKVAKQLREALNSNYRDEL
jgi:GTPase SAR1 family protein